ncbi:MAG: class I SAM-dependent methyltransferase [Ruminococcaceae bacterium]|nr:class I SAM-dependent methyltransferase [Oscillospiraceae bacterium]
MNKHEITAFFDHHAPHWDTHLETNDAKLAVIMDAAGIRDGVTVLDVACGTGVLFPYYLARNVDSVTAVDISPEMVRMAMKKNSDPRVEILCGDMEMLPVTRQYDCCVVYNAFPHFEEPARLVERLSAWVKPGGRLTVAHGMSLETLHRHHAGARHVSREMLTAGELAAIFAPRFAVDVMVSDDEKYIVSGVRRTEGEEEQV